MHRTRDWKYNRYLVHGEELYDLKNDPEEMVNLAADPGHQARKAEFSDALDQWMARNEDTAFAGYRPTHRDGTPFSG
jgi:arylsulfatase A-like enzyme